MSRAYEEAFTNFKNSFEAMLKRISNKLDGMSIKTKRFSTNSVTLENNTVHICTLPSGVKELTIRYPAGDFISTVIFSTAKSGSIKINFPDSDRTSFVGTEKLEFFPSENWELNIHNGRVAGTQIFRS
jgi:hypothetical protein